MSSEPTLAKLLQAAVDAGQVVFVHAPKTPPTLPIVPPDARDEISLAAALGLLFKLNHSESRVLASLMRHEHRSKEDLRAIITNAASPNIGTVTVCTLRKKLKPFSIEICTTYKVGYALDKKARDKIQKILTEHVDAIVAARQKSETLEP